MTSSTGTVHELSRFLMFGALLDEIHRRWGAYELVEHWQQGEFHHDIVLRVPAATAETGGEIIVVATNCNGGVKEVLCFATPPDRQALWHSRCPDNPEFGGDIPSLIEGARTEHWFDPCDLLGADARSEYKQEFRERQSGGGWIPRKSIA
jgi:hypothetical protein